MRLLLPLLLPSAAALTTPSGFTRTLFEEDFSLPQTAMKWSIASGHGYPGGPSNWGTNEVQSYTSDNVKFYNNALMIWPERTSSKTWNSARIESLPEYDFACPPGGKLRIEASLKFGDAPADEQMGIWPAFWAMGSAFRSNYSAWPSAGEIDIAESVNGVKKLYMALHCGWAPGGPCDEYNGLKMTSPIERGVFYTYAVEIDRTNEGGGWKGERLTWYVGGQVVFRVSGERFTDEGVWTAITRGKKFLILNVAVGGDFADNAENPSRVKTPTSKTAGGYGSGMEIQHVAVWST